MTDQNHTTKTNDANRHCSVSSGSLCRIPTDEEAEKRAERYARCRNQGNDPQDEYMQGFMACLEWIRENIPVISTAQHEES